MHLLYLVLDKVTYAEPDYFITEERSDFSSAHIFDFRYHFLPDNLQRFDFRDIGHIDNHMLDAQIMQ